MPPSAPGAVPVAGEEPLIEPAMADHHHLARQVVPVMVNITEGWAQPLWV